MPPLPSGWSRFWSNHLAVSTAGEPIVALSAGAYEREAIRPHVFGRFEDMVQASARHPAMLIYLDQVRSIGPNARAGRNNRRGLNENYARELLELHTLGVDGGYDQRDVEQLALILTGWTIGGYVRQRNRGPVKPFAFADAMHEPGPRPCSVVATPRAVRTKARRPLRTCAAIRPRRASSRPSWSGTSSATGRTRWTSMLLRASTSIPTAIWLKSASPCSTLTAPSTAPTARSAHRRSS